MIIPNHHTNSDGDIVFEITHLSESKKEKNKEILFDRLNYQNWITINPINNQIIRYECECQDFIIRKNKSEPCKHLTESFKLLEQYGISSPKP